MRSKVTGAIVPARCNSHLCPECAPLHQMAARRAIEFGLIRAWKKLGGERAIFLTLTEPANASLDMPGLHRRWKATRKRLARTWGMTEYGYVAEFQQRGALHPHVFAIVSDQVAGDLRDRRSRSSYRRRMHELRPMAQSLGWGQMVDAVTIDVAQAAEMGQYGAKALTAYATKETAARFKEAGAQRVRPVRLSRDWYPGGLAKARTDVLGTRAMAATKIEGEWERLRSVCGQA